ncbi:YbjN domain-containing protein [Brevundimonas lenta]|uniref:YbjN domain-containing protein n=1 Tax=Brevundimonas lenta TaxID=424796 RepID=A0A7W6JBV5_9CAUL|nr:YbjN domain-containing protein [Brevundimonas lenta]MBB4081316.1 hypothetical protein [Brevundimonas lenta]
MIRRTVSALAAAVVMATAAAPAMAQTAPAPAAAQPGLSISDVSAWIAAHGGQVAPVQRVGDQTFIAVRDGEMTWAVFFYGCTGDVCADIQYAAFFSNPGVTLDMVNNWNRDQRFLKAFYAPADAGGDPSATVQYDLLLRPGGVDQLTDPTAVWVGMLGLFARHVGFLVETPAPAAPPQ